MMVTTVQPEMETMTISFPKVDLARLKGIAKAMGWSINKMDYYDSPRFYKDLDEAEQAIAEGEGTYIANSQELDALFQ